MPKYRRRPVEIHAVLNDGNWDTAQRFLKEVKRDKPSRKPVLVRNKDDSWNICDDDGYSAPVMVGWYLVYDGKKFSPCRPEFFEPTYEPVEDK